MQVCAHDAGPPRGGTPFRCGGSLGPEHRSAAAARIRGQVYRDGLGQGSRDSIANCPVRERVSQPLLEPWTCSVLCKHERELDRAMMCTHTLPFVDELKCSSQLRGIATRSGLNCMHHRWIRLQTYEVTIQVTARRQLDCFSYTNMLCHCLNRLIPRRFPQRLAPCPQTTWSCSPTFAKGPYGAPEVCNKPLLCIGIEGHPNCLVKILHQHLVP